MQSAHRQSGTVLIVVIMLLLLASVLTFFALNVGVFEQRTSGNDLKAKMVAEVAEAGLSQGAEYLHSNPTFLTNTGKWTICTAADTSFPCGSVPPTRRSTMYYWSGGGYDFDGSGAISGWETKMLPITGPITLTGNFPVQYGVGAVLCRVAYKTLSTDPTVCTDSSTASNTSIITLVSVAALKNANQDEGARTTVTTSIGSYNIINNLPALPPIVASGSVNFTGTQQTVANPGAGGTGVPVSVWSPMQPQGNGTMNTCYYDEFIRGGSVTWNANLPSFPLCDSCSCGGSLTSVKGNAITAGIDMVTGVDSTLAGGNAAVHVDPDQTKTEFPCDLFQKVFNVQAWSDTNPVDGYCETHIMTTYTNPNNNTQIVTMGVDEAYLYTNANYIKPLAGRTYPCASGCVGTLTATALVSTVSGNDQTVNANAGLEWCQDGSLCANGTANAPVLVVIDGAAGILFTAGPSGSKDIYGLVFVRSTGDGPLPLNTTAANGNFGNATIDAHGNGTMYGSIIVQGSAVKLNGTSSIVYNKDILTNLQNSANFVKFGGVAGGWTDKTSY